jgi:hypothetical protein
MDNKAFWLIDLNTSVLSVSLVNYLNNSFIVSAIGSTETFTPDRESLAQAADKSLNSAAESAKLPEDQEPNSVALILPPLWIGSDGKIAPQYLKLIEYLCHDLALKPMGFIANDEAIVEDANQADGFPASFVLVNISQNEMFVSLTYLGKVIERLGKRLSLSFEPAVLESALLEFKTESTLPPQIILFGDINESILESIKNYPWIGKKNIETFLHFPDIKNYSPSEIVQIYTRAITSQFSPPPSVPISEPEIIEDGLTEVSAVDLGFDTNLEETGFSSDNLTVPEVIPEDLIAEAASSEIPVAKKPQFKLKLPRLHLPPLNIVFLPVIFLPLLILIPFFFSKAKITLSLTPYTFDKQIPVTLDSTTPNFAADKKIIPVTQQTFDVSTTAAIATTGQKTVGDKAQGEVIIFNEQSKSQNLASGAILIDDQGNKFILTSAIQVSPSTSDLNAGIITLGQTKAIISAADIGPEYNLAKDTKLHFKDFAETMLLAKVSTALAGGTKRQINAVSAQDKANLEQQMTTAINTAVGEKISNDVNSVNGLIKNSTQIKKSRLVYNREVGEEADQLSATATSTVYVFTISTDQKTKLLQAFLSGESGFSDSTLNTDNFELSINPTQSSVDKIVGTLSIKGSTIPKINPAEIIQLVSGKTFKTADNLIKNRFPRVYNLKITTNLPFLDNLNPLPFLHSHITVEIK